MKYLRKNLFFCARLFLFQHFAERWEKTNYCSFCKRTSWWTNFSKNSSVVLVFFKNTHSSYELVQWIFCLIFMCGRKFLGAEWGFEGLGEGWIPNFPNFFCNFCHSIPRIFSKLHHFSILISLLSAPPFPRKILVTGWGMVRGGGISNAQAFFWSPWLLIEYFSLRGDKMAV